MNIAKPSSGLFNEFDDSGCVNDDVSPTKVTQTLFCRHRDQVELLDLSDDVLLYVLRNLHARDLKALAFTCPRFAALSRDASLWRTADASSSPNGEAGLRWLILRALNSNTTVLRVHGYAKESINCLGHVKMDMDGGRHYLMKHDNGTILMTDRPRNGPPPPYWSSDVSSSQDLQEKEPPVPDPDCDGPIFTINRGLMTRLKDTCPKLSRLDLEYCNIDCTKISISDFPPTLKSLSLCGARCYNHPGNKSFLFQIQEHLPDLESLDVSHCSWLDPACLLPLSKLKGLLRLRMRSCARMSECVAYAALAARYGFRKLQTMDLRETPFADSEFSGLGWLPELREVYISPAKPSTEDRDKMHTHCVVKNQKSDRLADWENEEPSYLKADPTYDLNENEDLVVIADTDKPDIPFPPTDLIDRSMLLAASGPPPRRMSPAEVSIRLREIFQQGRMQDQAPQTQEQRNQSQEANNHEDSTDEPPSKRQRLSPNRLFNEDQQGPSSSRNSPLENNNNSNDNRTIVVEFNNSRNETESNVTNEDDASNDSNSGSQKYVKITRNGASVTISPSNLNDDLNDIEMQSSGSSRTTGIVNENGKRSHGGHSSDAAGPSDSNACSSSPNNKIIIVSSRNESSNRSNATGQPSSSESSSQRYVKFTRNGPSVVITRNNDDNDENNITGGENQSGSSNCPAGYVKMTRTQMDSNEQNSVKSNGEEAGPSSSNSLQNNAPGPADNGAGPSNDAGPSNVAASPSQRFVRFTRDDPVIIVSRNNMEGERFNMMQNPVSAFDYVRMQIVNVTPLTFIDTTCLVTDSSIIKFGDSDSNEGNILRIGAGFNGPGEYFGSRPKKSNLRVLSVTGFKYITNSSLVHLVSAAPHLRLIDFSNTSVTDSGVETFRNLRPDCEVIHSPYKPGDNDLSEDYYVD